MEVFQLLMSLSCCFQVLLEQVSCENSSIYSNYQSLKIELMNRPAIVHKLPADIEGTQSNPFILELTFYLREVVAIDQIEQYMTLLGTIKSLWNHKGLTWDPNLYGGLREIQLDSKDMWLPQFYVVVGDMNTMTFTFPDNVILNSSGYIYCVSFTYLTIRCRMDVLKFPFDTQTCNFGFFYKDQRQNKLDTRIRLSFTEINDTMGNADPYAMKSEWKLLKYKVESSDSGYGNYNYFTLKVRRQRLYYIVVVIFPLVLTSLMIPLVFVIPKNSGEKMSYLVTIYTSTAIFLSYISTVMPKYMDITPFLAILLAEVVCQGFCATLAALWVVSKYNDEAQTPSIHTVQETSTPQKMSHAESRTKEQFQLGLQKIETSNKTCILKLTGKQLDTFFFYLFQTGQILFIAYLFVLSGWLD